MSHLDDSGQQMDVWPKQSPLTRFARLCIGATWWIVASLANSAHNNVHSWDVASASCWQRRGCRDCRGSEEDNTHLHGLARNHCGLLGRVGRHKVSAVFGKLSNNLRR